VNFPYTKVEERPAFVCTGHGVQRDYNFIDSSTGFFAEKHWIVSLTRHTSIDSLIVRYVIGFKLQPICASLQLIDPAQEPLKMAISDSWLEFRLHVPSQITLGPHQSPLIVLNSHDALRSVKSIGTVRREDGRILQVGKLDVDGGRRLLVEA